MGLGSATAEPTNHSPDRPRCMRILGLLPPYTAEDVHRAYKSAALKLHPDRGGRPEDFMNLQTAYDQAQEYLRFHSGRRDWLAAQVEPYVKMQELIGAIADLGGRAEVESLDWMQDSFGDFATLADRVRRVQFLGTHRGDELLRLLFESSSSLGYLLELDLSGSHFDPQQLRHFERLGSLRTLNLRRTACTAADLTVLATHPNLTTVHVGGTPVAWWQRLWLAWRHPKIQWRRA